MLGLSVCVGHGGGGVAFAVQAALGYQPDYDQALQQHERPLGSDGDVARPRELPSLKDVLIQEDNTLCVDLTRHRVDLTRHRVNSR